MTGLVAGQPARIEPCACGLDIVVVRPRDPGQIEAAIRTHNATPEHHAWAEAEGYLIWHAPDSYEHRPDLEAGGE